MNELPTGLPAGLPMPQATDRLTFCTRLPAAAEAVWQRVTSPAGIQAELFPLLRMTVPAAWRGRAIDSLPVGQPLAVSWLLLAGCLPIAVGHLGLESLGPGLQFRERSRWTGLRWWTHHRRVEPRPYGCELVDELAFALRWPTRFNHWLLRRCLHALFAHRHRRLVRWSAGAG